MTRLILTTSDSGAGSLKQAGIADIVIPFGFRFVWEKLPSPELSWLSAARSGRAQFLTGSIIYRTGVFENARARRNRIDRLLRPVRNHRIVDRSRTKRTDNADLVARLFATSREDRFEAGSGPGRRRHRQPSTGRADQMAAAISQNLWGSSGNSQRGLAGLSRIDPAGLVQPAVEGFDRAAEASADCGGTA